MATDRVKEPLLQNYLLGHLSEEEQVRIEDRAFADPDYLGALEAVEADLIDAYVRGELSQPDRRQFERIFLTSPGRRAKVEFARAFAAVAAEFEPVLPKRVERQSFGQALVALTRRFPLIPVAAGVAALVLLAGTGWLAVRNAALQSRVARLEAQRVEMEKREEALRQQLSQQRRPNPEAPKTAPGEERPVLAASLVFLPGLTRGQSTVQQVSLAPGAQIVHVEIQLEARDNFPKFRADLHTRGGSEILARSGLNARRAGGAASVSFDVPASALAVGEYELALKGLSDGQSTDIGFYYFRVQKR